MAAKTPELDISHPIVQHMSDTLGRLGRGKKKGAAVNEGSSPQGDLHPSANTLPSEPIFELKDVSGGEEPQEEKPTLSDVDIVAVPRNFDISDSAWLYQPLPTEIHTRKKSKRSDTAEFLDQKDSKVSARTPEREQEKHNTATLIQEERKTVGSVGAKATPETISPTKALRLLHWLKDEGMLREAFRFNRILLLRSTKNLKTQDPLSIDKAAECLLSLLNESRKSCRKRPIVFIGHNSGVMVIEKALMLSSNGDSAAIQILRRTAGVIFLSSPISKAKIDSEQELNYFDATVRMASDSGNFRYTETSVSDYVEHHLKEFRATLKEAEKIALGDLERTVSHKIDAGPAAISLYRHQYLGKFTSKDDDVYLKIVSAITSSLECYRLLSAAWNGKSQALRSLLDRGISVNLQDRTGNTALHLAAITGRAEIVELLLLEYEANVALQNLKCRSALFFAVYSRKNNAKIVALLLKKGARAKDKDEDGDSPLMLSDRPSVSKEIKRLLRYPPFVDGPDDILNIKTWRTPTAPKSASAQVACKSFRAVVAEFFQFGTKEKFVLEDPSIHKLLYKSSPKIILEKARARAIDAEPMSPDEMDKAMRCRWYHIPANNVAWDLFAHMKVEESSMVDCQHQGSTPWSKFMRPQARKIWAGDGYANSGVLFMPYLHYEKRYDQSRIHRTIMNVNREAAQEQKLRNIKKHTEEYGRSTVDSDDDHVGITVSEPRDSSSPPNTAIQDFSQNTQRAMTEDEDQSKFLSAEARLIEGYLHGHETLHVRRTLDQSHYYILEDTEQRDDDQVVLRGGERGYLSTNVPPDSQSDSSDSENELIGSSDRKKVRRDKAQCNMVMVDQLWMWILGDTIVTSFPRKWTEPDGEHEDDILDRLLQHLRADKLRRPITSVYDFATLVTDFCTNVFDRSSVTPQLPLHDLFECSIGVVANEEIHQFGTFREACAEPLTRSKSKKSKQKIRKLQVISDIDKEIESLKEIKDIRDELHMILKILKDQAMVLSAMTAMIEIHRQDDAETRSKQSPLIDDTRAARMMINMFHQLFEAQSMKDQERIAATNAIHQMHHVEANANIRDFQKMLADADAVQDSLNHLLDLKQKQANGMEAKYAREAAAATSKQGNVIIVFTIVTIIFGSLSSVAAFFALNVRSFPKSSDGTTTIWQISHIVGLVVGISSALSIPFIGLAFYVNRLINFTERLWDNWPTLTPSDYASRIDKIDTRLWLSSDRPWIKFFQDIYYGLKFRWYWSRFKDRVDDNDELIEKYVGEYYIASDKAKQIIENHPSRPRRRETNIPD